MKRPRLRRHPRHETDAPSPWQMTRQDWTAVLKRAWAQVSANNVGLIAAGVAFYCFTAIVPTLASIVLTYGLVADAATVSSNINALFGVLPEEAARLISEQLVSVVETSSGQQGLGLVIALAIAFYGVTKATSSMIIALNVAYDEKETRGFIWLNVLSLLIVFGGLALVLTAFATTAVLAFLESLIPGAPAFVLTAIRITSYLLLGMLVVTAAAFLYRYAPNRPRAKWVWLSPGAAIATVIWLAATAGFGFYVSNFGNYGATYGSLSAVIVLLTWLWLSSYVFLIGAELNGELERQSSAHTLEDPNATAATDEGIKAEKRESLISDRATTEGESEPPPAPASGAKATLPARSTPSPASDQPGTVRSAVRLKAGARAGGGKLGLPSALLAGAGLARLKRGSPMGAGLVAGAAAIAWAMREKPSE